MSYIMSIILCIALAFSGVGTLPAEPETATTWTISGLTMSNGDESFTLNPSASITAAIGADRADFHFEIENGGKTLLPVSAEFSKDALRFALAGGDAYSLSEADLMELMDIDPDTVAQLEIISDLFTSYGALIGLVCGSEEEAAAYSQALFTTLYESCEAAPETVEIEYDGETLSAEKAELSLTLDTCFALLDGLRDCGYEPMENLMDTLLVTMNLLNESDYADYATFRSKIDEDVNFALPMTVTLAQTDDLGYGLIECDFQVEDELSMQLREEITARGEQTGLSYTVEMNTSDSDANFVVTAQMTGPITAPTALHMDYDIATTTTNYIVYETEDEDGEEAVEDDYTYTTDTTVHMTLDSNTTDGLGDARLDVTFETTEFDETTVGTVTMTATDRSEDDGSVTTDIAITVNADDEEFGLSFALNRAVAAFEDLFGDVETREITAADIKAADDAPSANISALMSDVMRLAADAMQLSSDESVQALFGVGTVDDIYAD